MRSAPARWSSAALLAFLIAVPCGPALGWGARGHRVATRVAESRLSPAARAAVRALLHEGDSLVDVCTWADHEGHDAVPGSARWHYVNVPITAARYDDRDCPGGNCVVGKIKHFRKVLADRHAPRAERARALLFFVHLVEDVHQPLHVGDNHDRGGNDTQVQFDGRGSNLHRVWDSQVIDGAGRDERAWVAAVEPLLTPENIKAWSRGGVESWADESLAEAKKAYHFPEGAARPIAGGTRLGPSYSEFALPIIRLRLAQAGARLANELNAVFATDAGETGQADDPALGPKVVAFARGHLGERVADGQCTSLAVAAIRHAGARPMPLDRRDGDYVWGRPVASFREAVPGDILQFRDAVFRGKARVSSRRSEWWRREYPHHTAIVASVKDGGKVVTILHQNIGPHDAPDAVKKVVQEETLRTDSLQDGGRVWIYRPLPAGPEPDRAGGEGLAD